MMRLIQKLDKFDTKNQKNQNLTVVIKNRVLLWCKLFFHFDQSTTGE
jgi:hypothetical protein